MGSLSTQQNHQDVSVVMIPFPAQGHLNTLMQLSCLISSYDFPVHYVGSAIHNRQAISRVNGLDPLHVSKIHFHDLPISPFANPSPDPNSSNKFPAHLQPTFDATMSLHEPVTAFLRDMASKSRRVVVIHDALMALMVKDIGDIPNAESYSFNCVSALCMARLFWEKTGLSFPDDLKDLPSVGDGLSGEFQYFLSVQFEHLCVRSGDLYNTTRLFEGPYLDLLARKDIGGVGKVWGIGPLLPAKLASDKRHECLNWLDKQEPKSVIYVTFGTTTSMPDEQVCELALGLEQSKQRFLWVLRDADKGDVFDAEVRRPKLPDGFEERVKGVGLVVREWAPQPEILAHPSTGGFMSHCGWNSCMESITMGVPIAAWPMHSDQPINTSLVTNVLKTGLIVREWAEREEIVKASKVESVVKALMASEEGDEIRKRAEELAVSVHQVTKEGGVSRVELDSFVEHIAR